MCQKNLYIRLLLLALCIPHGNLFSQENFLDSLDLSNKKLLIIGEVHDNSGNSDLQLIVLDYLLNKYDSIIVIAEFPISFEYNLNKYFELGDYNYISNVLEFSKNEDDTIFLNGLKRLKDKNKTVKNIIYKGIDWDPTCFIGLEVLIDLIPDFKAPKKIISNFYELGDIYSSGNFKIKKTLKLFEKFKTDIQINEKIYKDYLGDNFILFKKNIEAQIIGLKYNSRNFLPPREDFMTNNILNLSLEYPNHFIFGQFGMIHVSKDSCESWIGYSDWESFTTKLIYNSNSFTHENICSIILYYPYCPTRFKYMRKIVKNSIDEFGYHLIESKLEGNYSLFNSENINEKYSHIYDYIISMNKW